MVTPFLGVYVCVGGAWVWLGANGHQRISLTLNLMNAAMPRLKKGVESPGFCRMDGIWGRLRRAAARPFQGPGASVQLPLPYPCELLLHVSCPMGAAPRSLFWVWPSPNSLQRHLNSPRDESPSLA